MSNLVKSADAFERLMMEGARRDRAGTVTGAMLGAGIAAIVAPSKDALLLVALGALVGAALGSQGD